MKALSTFKAGGIRYAIGADVPEAIEQEFGLTRKGLVEAGGVVGSLSATTEKPAQPTIGNKNETQVRPNRKPKPNG